MEFSSDQQVFATDLENALIGLTRLTKALNFYPSDHPTLVSAAEETCSDFQPLLAHQQTYPCDVSQSGFSVAEVPLAPKNQTLKKLALTLIERRVQHLFFLPELSNYELLIFAEELSKPATQLLNEGGMAKQLTKRHVRSIWVNETELETVLNTLREMGLKPPLEAATDTPQGDDTRGQERNQLDSSEQSARPQVSEQQQIIIDRVRDLLEQLKDPLDNQTYEILLKKLQQLAPAFFRNTGIAGYLAVLNLLESHRRDETRNPVQQQAANNFVDTQLTEPCRKILADALADQNLKASQRRALTRLLINLNMKIAPQLLKRLFAERDAIIRRDYTSVLAHMGESTFDLLQEALQHHTWHVVRNAVTILGETRLDSALPLITQAIDHPEVRVRRSVIRALSAIGSNAAIPLLLRLVKDDNEELHQPAIMALGTLKNSRAIPSLVELLRKPDLFGQKTQLKTRVIQALAATNSPRAIIPLLRLARRANLLSRKNIEILRAEAILALGQLGNAQLIPVLERLPKTDKGPVSRALKQATAQLRKQQNIA